MWSQKHWKDPPVVENNLSSLDNRKEEVTVKFRTLILVKAKGKNPLERVIQSYPSFIILF